MDFFDQQDKARAASRRLVALYGLAVAGILLAIHSVVAGLLMFAADQGSRMDAFGTLFLKPELCAWTVGLALGVIAFGTLAKIAALRGGGPKVAESQGGREILPNTRDLAERRLLNVVEEMALAAGVRVPRTYVLDAEDGLNAFAAGYSPDDAAIAVTAGLLRTLNREELQGVIGHEFSHVLNGDMRLNIRLIGILGGILGLAVVGRVVMEIAGRSLRYSSVRRSKKNDGAGIALAIFLLGIALWIIGSVGVLFGRLIQCAVSRHREFLADASATQFTRNPTGLANALKLIQVHAGHGALANGRSSEVAHMLFASGGTSLFATHPSLQARIQRLDPSFHGDLDATRKLLERRREPQRDDHDPVDGTEPEAVLLSALRPALRFDGVQDAIEKASPPPPPDNEAPVLAWLGADERSALRNADSAECCLYASILSADPPLQARQLDTIRTRTELGAQFAEATEGWRQRHAEWTARQRRMACELAAGTLRAEPETRRNLVLRILDALAAADGQVDSFEFALGRLVRRRLTPPSSPASLQGRTLPSPLLATEASHVLFALAQFGGRGSDATQTAWEAGTRALSLFGANLQPPDREVSFPEFEAALARLVHLPPLAKREFMMACGKAVKSDGVVTEEEENYLAAVADAIEATGWRPSA